MTMLIGFNLEQMLDLLTTLPAIVPSILCFIFFSVLVLALRRSRELTLIPVAIMALALAVLYTIYQIYQTDLPTISAYGRPAWSVLVVWLIFHFWIKYLTGNSADPGPAHV